MAKERSEEEQIETGEQAHVENPSAAEQHDAEEALAEELTGESAQEAEIASLHQQLAEHKDMVLRAQAE